MSYPVLSLRNVPSMSSTSPFARTTSRPVKQARKIPKQLQDKTYRVFLVYVWQAKDATASNKALMTPNRTFQRMVHFFQNCKWHHLMHFCKVYHKFCQISGRRILKNLWWVQNFLFVLNILWEAFQNFKQFLESFADNFMHFMHV